MTSSASEATLFGSTPNDDAAGASARVSWGGFPSPEGLEKSEVDSGQRPQRTDTRDSDMSDEFFGFSSSGSAKVTKDDVDDPLAGGPFSAPVSKPKASKANELFSDDADLFSISIENTNKTEPAIAKTSANQDDVFSVGKAKEERKTKTAEPLVAKDSAPSLISTKAAGDDLFSSINDKTPEKKLVPSSEKTPSKPAESPKISSPLDNDDLFSTDKSVAKTTTVTKASKTEAKLPVKEKAPVLDDESFSSSSVKDESKPEKKENQKVTADKKISSPLGDDDDLFAVSTPAKKDINKSVTDSATKKTASPQTNKKTTPKSSTILDVSTLSSLSNDCSSPSQPALFGLSRFMVRSIA